MARSHRDILESRMLGNLARPVWGWGPGEIPRPTPLLVGSPAAGERAAIVMSLLASCKFNAVEPWAYIRYVLTKLAYGPTSSELESLLPNVWLAANPSHRWNIDDVRRKERQS